MISYIAVLASINNEDISEQVTNYQSAIKRYNLIDTNKKAIVKINFKMNPETYLGTSEVHFLHGNKEYVENLGVDFNGKSYGTVSMYMI